MGKLAWLVRNEPDEEWKLLSKEPADWQWVEIKRVVYFSLEEN